MFTEWWEKVSSKNNVESKQHNKYQKELLRLHREISKYKETLLKVYKIIRHFWWE